MKTIVLLLMVFLSVIGIADASFLTYEKFSGNIPTCGDGFDCGTVLNSQYASIGPIPLSLFGVGYYLTVLLLVISMYLEFPIAAMVRLPKVKTQWLLMACTSFGFAFSLVLVGVMAFVIKAWCLFCLVSAATSTLLFICSLSLFSSDHHDTN